MSEFGAEVGVVVLIAVGVIVFFAFLKYGEIKCDGWRVRGYIEDRGGRMLSSSWSPLGKGWLRSQDARLYEVRYVDREGNIHEATCRTAPLAGVYFTDDRVEKRDTSDGERLAEENRQLREESEKLREENRLLKQALTKGKPEERDL